MRLARRSSEHTALKARHAAALEDANNRGIRDIVYTLEADVARSVAVINVDIYFLRNFMTRDNQLYATYHQTVRAGTRKAAERDQDRERNGVDGTLFGKMADQIITAALSLECRGLSSYGSYCMQLRDVAVAKRATVLEGNSYSFVKKHNILPGSPIPEGYSSDWSSRAMLASTKLISRLSSATTEASFQHLLLISTGDRRTDEFLEVHIYGAFDNRAVEKVSAPVPTDVVDIAIWGVIKELLVKAGKTSEEY